MPSSPPQPYEKSNNCVVHSPIRQNIENTADYSGQPLGISVYSIQDQERDRTNNAYIQKPYPKGVGFQNYPALHKGRKYAKSE